MKTIFITGGSTGIGAASVRKFVEEGWNVGFMDINVSEANKLMEEIGEHDRVLFVEGNTRLTRRYRAGCQEDSGALRQT